MPKQSSISKTNNQARKTQNRISNFPYKFNNFLCRLCNRPHSLRTCPAFLAMNVQERIRAVRNHKYCGNCLAHNHSKGACFTKHGCWKCSKLHHTLLHINNTTSTPSHQNSSSSTKSTHKAAKKPLHTKSSTVSTSLTAILRQNSMILLPTVLVKINNKTLHARCLLDSGSPLSRISRRFVTEHNLTTLTLQEETICPLTLKSRFDATSKIEGTFRVDNRITIQTPSQTLDESFKKNFRDLFLADPKFYESSGIDVVIGVDMYPKVICDGVISKKGIPTAQSTIFGWVVYGSYTA